ncbi:hypothetical protein ACEV7R_23290, partial [Vibrio parahaemolyticus]
ITSSFFMLEYIAATLPGIALLPGDAFNHYRARASAQFLGGLGADVAVLGCARHLAPVLRTRNAQKLLIALAEI